MLELKNIEVKYSNVILVLRGVSMEVKEEQIVCLLGANGAGKSTTLKAVSGLLQSELGYVSDGIIEFEGKEIQNEDPEIVARKGIIQIQEGRKVLEHLTVYENLMMGAYTRKERAEVRRDIEMVYGYFPVLKNLSNRASGYLSGGEQQMLVVGRAMMGRPKLMMLDEASLGLSPLLVHEIFDIIRRFNKDFKKTILVVEQNVRVALEISDYAYVMENGKVVLDGPAGQLIENEDIKEFYMGLGQLGNRKSYREVKHYRRRKRWLG